MYRLLSLAGVGLLATCLTLATPSAGKAQGYGYGSYSPGYGGCAPGWTGLGGSIYGSSSYGGYGYGGQGYGGYSLGRPPTVHPQYPHGTSVHGWYGHIQTPHRGHHHTRPY